MSIDVQPLKAPNKAIENFLRKDLPLNGLPLYDLTLAWDFSSWYIAQKNQELIGCLIIYTGGRGMHSFFTRGSPKAVDKLVASLTHPAIFAIVPQDHKPIVEKHYQFLSEGEFILMCLEQSSCHLGEFQNAVRLTPEDVEEVDTFYQTTTAGAWNPNQLTIGPFYGIRDKTKLVSICGTIGVYHTSPGVSVIGNLVTLPQYQNRGYGTSVLCAVIRDLFTQYRYVTLMVESDNHNAIRIYDRLGFVVHTKLAIGVCQRRD
jgi:ribosomal protein S18 acetylase RimI-like enzyme